MSFSEETIQKVWEQGSILFGFDPDLYRQDLHGAWIQRDKYGDHAHVLGWGIDCIRQDGSVRVSNLQPLHWKHYKTQCTVAAMTGDADTVVARFTEQA